MAFSFKPKQPPTSFSAAVHDKALTDLYQQVFGKPLPKGTAIADWKRYVESSERWDGAEAGGMRDVLNANAYAQDALKADHDSLDDREATHYQNLNTRVGALEAAPAVPFPASFSPQSSRAATLRRASSQFVQRLRAIAGPRSS